LRISARRIEFDGERLVATGSVSVDEGRLRAGRVELSADRWVATGSVSLGGGRLLAQRAAGSAADGVQLEGGVRFAPCPCGPFTVSLSGRRAGRAADAGDDWVIGPSVARVGELPVMALPPLSIPTRRRSGLLAPRLRGSRSEGVRLGIPFFVPVGSDHDLTITPGLATNSGPVGELEWAAAGPGAGRAEVRLDDRRLGPRRPDDGAADKDEPDVRGRGAVDATAATGALGMEVHLRSDPGYEAEFAPSWSGRQTELLRSEVGWAEGPWSVRGGWQQDLRPQRYGATAAEAFQGGLRTPGLFAADDPTRVRVGNAAFEVAGRGRWWRTSQRLLVDGFVGPSQGRSFVRGDARTGLEGRWPLPPGFHGSTELALRLTGWAGGEPEGRVAPVVRMELGWRRRFGFPRRSLQVSLRQRAAVIPAVAGRTPANRQVFDHVDLLERLAHLRWDFDLSLRRGEHRIEASTWIGQAVGWQTATVDWVHRWRWRRGRWSAEVGAVAGIRDGSWPLVEGRLGRRGARAGWSVAVRRWGSRPADPAFVGPEGLLPQSAEPRSGYVPLDAFLASADRADQLPFDRTVQGEGSGWVAPFAWLVLDARVAWSLLSAPARSAYGVRFLPGVQRLRVGATVRPAHCCWRVRVVGGGSRDLGGAQAGLSLGWEGPISDCLPGSDG
jgi:hypothetical protein